MRIKLKIKTLMMMLLVLVILFTVVMPRGNIILARVLDRMDSPYAGAFYEKYLNQNFGNPSLRARVEYAESLVDGFYRYGIFTSFQGGGSDHRPEDLEEAKNLLISGLEGEKDPSSNESTYVRAYRLLMDLMIATGDMDGFMEWIEIDPGDSEELAGASEIYQLYHEVYFGDMEAAKVALTENRHPVNIEREHHSLMAEIALREGDREKAREHMEKAGEFRPGEINDQNRTYFGTGAFQNQQFWLDTYEKDLAGEFTLSGRVTFEGEPMAFVEIYVKSSRDTGWSSSGERFVAITDEEGYFESIGLRRGSYDIGIGVDTSRLYDKYYVQRQGELADGHLLFEGDQHLELEFTKPIEIASEDKGITLQEEDEFHLSWEPVDGAEYYQAYFIAFTHPKDKTGGHSQRPLFTTEAEQKIQGSEAVFTIGDINKQGPGGIVTFSDEERLLGPSGVLRPMLPGIEYPLIIKAYDKDGQEITSSLALRGDYNDVFHVNLKGELSEGEELILDQSYPEAIAYYEEHLKDPDIREEALRTLTLLYHYGWKQGERDVDLAFNYGKVYYEETGHSRNLELVMDGMTFDELKEYKEEVKEILAGLEPEDDYHLLLRTEANLHLIDGEWEEAVASFEKSDRTIPWQVFYLDLLIGDYKQAAERLRDHRFHVYRMEPLNMEDALMTLSFGGLAQDEEDHLRNLMETLVMEDRDQAQEVYREILPDIENDELREVLYGIYLMNNWDREW